MMLNLLYCVMYKYPTEIPQERYHTMLRQVWVSWYIGEALEVSFGYLLEWGNDNKWRCLSVISLL